MHAAVTTTTQEQMPPITHLLIFLYNLGHCWVVIFHAHPLAFWDLTGFIQFGTLWIFQCRRHGLPRRWFRCRCIVHNMAFTSERVPPVDADTAVDALRPRCRGAFLAHFLFPHFSLNCSFCSLFSSLLFALTWLSLLHTMPSMNSYTKLKQWLHYDRFTISHAVQICVVL